MAENNKMKVLKDSGESKQQLAYEQIKKDILNNTYPEGTVLVERRLCEIYNVSRSPIRNALQQLSHEGLLDFIPGKGATVAGFSIEDILEVYDLIEVLQLYAARQLCAKIDDLLLGSLNTCLINMKSCLDDGDVLKSTRWDQKFHHFIITASANKRLAVIYDQLAVQNQRFIATILDDAQLAMRSWQEHEIIFQAMKNRDLSGIEDGIRTHYKNIKQYYVDKLIHRINI